MIKLKEFAANSLGIHANKMQLFCNFGYKQVSTFLWNVTAKFWPHVLLLLTSKVSSYFLSLELININKCNVLLLFNVIFLFICFLAAARTIHWPGVRSIPRPLAEFTFVRFVNGWPRPKYIEQQFMQYTVQ